MTEEGIDFLSGCINDFIAKDGLVSYVKHNNTVRMNTQDFERISITSNEYSTYYHEYVSANMVEAYEPFLTLCSSIINENDMDVKQLLDIVGVYSLHKSVFIKYFRGQECVRDEEILVPEVEFEKKKFLEDLGKIMEYLTKDRPLFIFINKINLACSSALDYILYMMNLSPQCNIKIMCMGNELGNVSSYIKERFTQFRDLCKEQRCVYDWPYNIVDSDVEIETGFVYRADNTTEYYDKINTMFNTLAVDQAMYYLGIMYQKIELEKINTSAQFKISMLCYYAWLNIFKLNASYALLICDSLKNVECSGGLKNVREYQYNYLVANANMYNGNEIDARESASICIDIAQRMKDDFLEFRANLIMNMTELSGWKDIWICEKEINVSDKLISDCKKYRYFNHLAHIYIYCYDNDYRLYRVIGDLKESIPHVNLGIKIAEEMNNYQMLTEAYRKNVMIASYNGLFSVSSYFYNKSILIAKKTNNRIEEANIYNGLGYNSTASDHFKEAHKYYCKALKIYFEHRMSDYVVETLYNMGMNAILAEDYTNATRYLETVITVLRHLKKNSIRVCNISKIFGLVALSTYREGNYYLSQFYLNKSKQFLDFILGYDVDEFYSYLWDDDIFLYYFVAGLTDVGQGKYEKAIENYKKAKVFVDHINGSAFFNYPQYMVAYAEVYKLMGDVDRCNEILLEGREKFNVMGNLMRVKQIDDLLENNEVTSDKYEMTLEDTVSIEQIIEQTHMESVEMEAQAKKKDIQFFTTFQELINHPSNSIDTFIVNMVSTFKNNFNLDNVLFINCEEGESEIKYSDIEYDISRENVSKIVEYFRNETTGFAISQFSNNFHEYKEILEIFRASKIFSMVGVPIRKNDELTGVFITFVKIQESWNSSIDRDMMDEDDLEIFTYVFRQIIDALDKFKMNQLLRKQAETDQLTGLYNRKIYYDRMDKILGEAVKKGKKIDIAIIYADLDHFKYYNDHFGHSVGDAVLVEFGKIFKNASQKLGWVIRFGGDEFIIVLDTAEYDTVKTVVDNIYKSIEQSRGFEDIVKKYTNEDISISKEHRASCSIGVAMAKGINDVQMVADIRRCADDALYRVKRNGRGYAEFVTDIDVSKIDGERY